MNVTIVLLKQVATMIRYNRQLCLKILRERFGIRFLPHNCYPEAACLMDIADIRMLSNHRFITFMFSADGYCNSSSVKRN